MDMAKPATTLLLGALILSAMASVPAGAADPQADLDRFAAGLGYRVTVVDNRPVGCPVVVTMPPSPLPPVCMIFDIDLDVPAGSAPPAGLTVQASHIGSIRRIDSAEFDTRPVNGDVTLFMLKPGRTLAAGGHYRLRLTASFPFFARAFALPNVTVGAPGLAPRVVAATRPGTDADTGLETLPYVAPMTDEARLATATMRDRNRWLTPERAFARYAARGTATRPEIVILPSPLSAQHGLGAPLDLSRGVRLSLTGISRAAIAPALAALGVGDGPVPLSIAVGDPTLPAEGYRLDTDGNGIRIAAHDAAGASYALRSLGQQALAEGLRLRPLTIRDAPRYGYRGLHIDVARNFHGRSEILRLIEQAAALKLNRLHLHLGDDEGWRMQIPALPELTEVGAYRCAELTDTTCLQPQLGADPARTAATNGFLTSQDYLAILAAAKVRQIMIVPSFDMPGHSRAAIKAMEARYRRLSAAGHKAAAERYRLVEPGDTTRYKSIQNYDDNTLNVCIPQTYRFVETVVAEMARLHARAGTPLTLYHIGADETAGAWRDSPTCRAEVAKTGTPVAELGARFVERVATTLAAKGIRAAAWSDGFAHADAARLPRDVQSHAWGGLFNGGVADAQAQANRGWSVILSIPDVTYLDMPQAVDPDEPGATWATRELDLFRLYGFMPGNLPANAAIITDIRNRPGRIADTVPLTAGHAIAGIQGQLWSEMIRRDSQVEYMLFPRLFALAERGWSRAAWEPAYVAGADYAYGDARVNVAALLDGWRDFAGRVAVRQRALDGAGLLYRLAPPGARIADGRLEANSELPNIPIEYRVAGGNWTPYTGPIATGDAVDLRTRTADGKRVSRTISVQPGRSDWQ
jgi:hexosaminidase